MNSSKNYNVKKLNLPQKEWWKETEQAKLDCFPWSSKDKNDFCPVTNAWLGTDGSSIFVYMETDETKLRIETKGFGFVHTDSCMEFFISPNPASPRYLNFEFNPAAAMYLSIGTSRYDREELPLDNYLDLFQVKTNILERGWNLQFHIPLSFLKRFFPLLELIPGCTIRGNFYKCGDKTERPHHGCWSPIDLPKPDFHCPAFFGTLTFV